MVFTICTSCVPEKRHAGGRNKDKSKGWTYNRKHKHRRSSSSDSSDSSENCVDSEVVTTTTTTTTDDPICTPPILEEKFDKRDVLRNVLDTDMKIDDNGEGNNSE